MHGRNEVSRTSVAPLRPKCDSQGLAGISDDLWTKLLAAFSVEQILELIALVGFYHTVSFFANGLRLPPESYAAPFPEQQPNTTLNADARDEPAPAG